MITNPVIDALTSHRSIRKFKPQALEPELVESLLSAGVRAATALNLQSYSIIVVDDPAKKKALCDDPMAEHSTMFFACADEYRNKRWFQASQAPFYFDQAATLFMSIWDAILVLQYIVLAAESLGLGTVFIGRSQGMDVQGVLGTPECVFPAGMALIGYPDEAPALRPRLPLEAVVHHNGYHIYTDEEIERYYQGKNAAWNDLPEETRRSLEARGIHNMAQRLTLGNYTEEMVLKRSRDLLHNLERACIHLEDQ